MAVLPNPYHQNSPLGAALANFASVMTGGKSQAQRISEAEQALKLQQTRLGTEGVANAFQMFGQPGYDRNTLMHDAVMAGYDPSDLGGMELYGAANQYGAADPRTTNAFVGAGGAYSGTSAGYREGLANDILINDADNVTLRANNADDNVAAMTRFNNTPYTYINPETRQPMIGTQQGAIGQQPILSETDQKGFQLGDNWGNLGALPVPEQRVLGAYGDAGGNGSLFNYVAPDGTVYLTRDGVTDVQSGTPLPAGGYRATAQGTAADVGLTTATQSAVQGDSVSEDRLRATFGLVRDVAENSDPSMFGLTGSIRGGVQGVSQLASNLAQSLGYSDLNTALADARQELESSGIAPGLLSGIYDPQRDQLLTLTELLTFQVARAMSGSGPLSEADVRAARMALGDPRNIFTSKESFLTKIGQLEQWLGVQSGVTDEILGGNSQVNQPAPPPSALAGPSTAPAGGALQPGAVFTTWPDGRPVNPGYQIRVDANGVPRPEPIAPGAAPAAAPVERLRYDPATGQFTSVAP